MIRGTTPTYTFDIPLDASSIADLRLSFAQEGTELVKKTKNDVKLEGQKITIKLTQEDTLKFDHEKSAVQIQLRVLTTGGDVMTSNIMTVNVWQSLNEEVLTTGG